MDSIILSKIPVETLLSLIKNAVHEEFATGHISDTSINVEKPVTTKELCDFLGVTEPTVLRWRKKGKIPFFHIGTAVRFNLKDVIKSLEKK